MSDRRTVLRFGALGLAAAVAGGVFSTYVSRDASPLAAAQFTDLNGAVRDISEWKSHIVVLNFWATWCPPCLEEIPMLMGLRDKYAKRRVEFLGIAVDRAENVRRFAAKMQTNYPIMVGGASTLELIRSLGNSSGGLPFTILLDRKGRVAFKNLGAVSSLGVEDQIQALLKLDPPASTASRSRGKFG